mgnify:CR=1 FL=1
MEKIKLSSNRKGFAVEKDEKVLLQTPSLYQANIFFDSEAVKIAEQNISEALEHKNVLREFSGDQLDPLNNYVHFKARFRTVFAIFVFPAIIVLFLIVAAIRILFL